MIRVISGEKGSGKTKLLLDEVHKAVAQDSGAVVFVNKGGRHIHDLSFKVRLVETETFGSLKYDSLYGLICGITTQNFDISHIFIDSLTKIAVGSLEETDSLLENLNSLATKLNINIVISISIPDSELTPAIKKYSVAQ